MKSFTILASLFGLFLVSLLIAYFGAGEVFDAVKAAGWATLLVVLARVVAIAGDGAAWRFLFPRDARPGVALCMMLRGVREGINQLLPVAQVGGDFIGARLLTFWGHNGTLATASVVSDIATQAATQFTFAVVGLVLLVWLHGDGDLVRYIGFGLIVAALGLAGFFLLLRPGGSTSFQSLVTRLLRGRDLFGAGGLVQRLFSQLAVIYANPRGVAACTGLHMAIWLFGSVEVWVVLDFMGYPVTIAEALVIESLGQAVRGAAFAVPGALGVQEGGFIALCALFGVPAGPALALSLVKRVPDLVIGIPGLLTWQWIEGRQVLQRRRSALVDAAGPNTSGLP
jgi:putative membrane protein